MSDINQQLSEMIESLGTQGGPPPAPANPQEQRQFIQPPVVEVPNPQQPQPQGVVHTLDGTPVDLSTINPDNLDGAPQTEAPQVEQPQTPQPTADSTVAMLQQQIAQQQLMLQQLAAQMNTPSKQEGVVPEIAPLDPNAILSQKDVEGLIDETGRLDVQKLLQLFQLSGQRSYQMGREHTLRDVPAIVAPTLTRQATIQAAVSTFWAQNQDLQPFRQQIAAEANMIAAQNPNLDMGQVLSQTANSVRGKLQAAAQASTRVAQMQQPQPQPGFVPQGLSPVGNRPQAPVDNRSDMQKDLDAMFNAVG